MVVRFVEPLVMPWALVWVEMVMVRGGGESGGEAEASENGSVCL